MPLRQHFDYFVRNLIEWRFQRKSPGFVAMRIGAVMLTLALAASWVFDVSFPIREARFSFKLDTSGGAPAALLWIIVLAAIIMIVGGFIFETIRYGHDQRRLAKKRVLVIEGRGLRDIPGKPLADALPAHVEGRREPYLLDLRQRVEDGKIVNPTPIIEKIEALPSHLDHVAGGQDRSDLTVAYGGLTAVPFTFLTGVILDDEDRLVVLD
jgi:hypothetical protein